MRLCQREVGLDKQIFLIAGPCVIETYDIAMKTAETIANISLKQNILCIYKSSFDKANRSSRNSYRGPGLDRGLDLLSKVKKNTGLPITTDAHDPRQIPAISEVADLIQIPALLARQTDLVEAAAMSALPVHFKKPQFMAAHDMQSVINKAKAAATSIGQTVDKFLVGERGTCFGYNDLVSDMRGLAVLRKTGCPVIFDATHSTQIPNATGDESGGRREFSPLLVRCAVAAGVSGIFLETHPSPGEALCDRAIQWPLDRLETLVNDACRIDNLVKQESLWGDSILE